MISKLPKQVFPLNNEVIALSIEANSQIILQNDIIVKLVSY
jgi:hypothetical protein